MADINAHTGGGFRKILIFLIVLRLIIGFAWRDFFAFVWFVPLIFLLLKKNTAYSMIFNLSILLLIRTVYLSQFSSVMNLVISGIGIALMIISFKAKKVIPQEIEQKINVNKTRANIVRVIITGIVAVITVGPVVIIRGASWSNISLLVYALIAGFLGWWYVQKLLVALENKPKGYWDQLLRTSALIGFLCGALAQIPIYALANELLLFALPIGGIIGAVFAIIGNAIAILFIEWFIRER